MKYLYLFLLSFLIFSCSNNNEVYWCGDHACINKKERRIYFSETMTVEVRKKDKNVKLNKRERDEILKEIKLKDKKYSKKIKNNNDSFIEENDLIIKEIKNNQTINSEAIIDSTKEKKKKNVKKKKKKFFKKKDDKILVSNESGLSMFNELAKKISKRNESKDYPDINNIESNND